MKILDFGLAKLRPQQNDQVDSQAPTQRKITDPGTVMGTVGYMSPKQVRGQDVDTRSDLFSFGVILYEMLSGHRTFNGESAIEVMNAILKEEPPELSETNLKINPQLEKIVRRCLEKKPERRFQTASDLGFALETLSGSAPGSAGILPADAGFQPALTGRHNHIAWLTAAVFILTTLGFAWAYFTRKAEHTDAPVVRFVLNPPEKATAVNQAVLSPDGRNLVLSVLGEGKRQLWLRPLGSITARPLPGTEGTSGFPFWSPDSRFMAFISGNQLKKIDLTDGTQLTLCNLRGNSFGFGGTWNREGTILFFSGNGIYRISATGGEPALVPGFDLSRQDILYRWPQFLPDGSHFLYHVTATQQEKAGIYLASLDGKEQKRLFAADSSALFALSPAGEGYLLFARDGALLAQPFDASHLTLKGEPFRIADQVRVNANKGGFFSVSDNGTLVYDPNDANDEAQLAWFDRTGKRLETVGAPGSIQLLALSPDEKRVAVSRRDLTVGIDDLYVMEIARGASTRLTSESIGVGSAIWSPDGNYLVWNTNRSGAHQLYRKPASGTGQEELLVQSNNLIFPTDWSADGKYIFYTEVDPKTQSNRWVLPLEGNRKPYPFLQTSFSESSAVLSPDGRWIAYRSDESGTVEVYVQTFPASGGKWTVSTKGGFNPRWRRDGKELFYNALDGKLMAVEIKTGGTFEPGIPKPLFDFSALRAAFGNNYAVAADGQRFLFAIRGAETTPSSLTVVLNWMAEVKR